MFSLACGITGLEVGKFIAMSQRIQIVRSTALAAWQPC